MLEALLPLLVGIAVGVVVGALGAGGGILSVPILVYLLAQAPHAAAASSLVIVGSTAVASLVEHVRRGTIVWRPALTFASVTIVGSLVGTALSRLVSGDVLMVMLATLLVVAGLAMLVRARTERAAEASATEEVGAFRAPPRLNARFALKVVLVGLTTGMLTGFFGVGGGFITVPLLVLVLHTPVRRAAGTSLLAMIFSSTAGLLGRVGAPIDVDWTLTLLFTLGSVLGGLVGGPLTRGARASTLTFVFAFLLLAVSAFTFSRTLGLVPA